MRNRPLLFCFTCDISKKKNLGADLAGRFFPSRCVLVYREKKREFTRSILGEPSWNWPKVNRGDEQIRWHDELLEAPLAEGASRGSNGLGNGHPLADRLGNWGLWIIYDNIHLPGFWTLLSPQVWNMASPPLQENLGVLLLLRIPYWFFSTTWSFLQVFHNLPLSTPFRHAHGAAWQVRLEQVVAMDVNFALLTRVWCVAELVEADHLHIHQVSLKSRKCCQFPVRQGIVEKETNDILWDFVKVLGLVDWLLFRQWRHSKNAFLCGFLDSYSWSWREDPIRRSTPGK